MIQYKLVGRRKTKRRKAHPVLLKLLMTPTETGWKIVRELGHQRILPATLSRMVEIKRKDEQRAQARRRQIAKNGKLSKLREAIQVS